MPQHPLLLPLLPLQRQPQRPSRAVRNEARKEGGKSHVSRNAPQHHQWAANHDKSAYEIQQLLQPARVPIQSIYSVLRKFNKTSRIQPDPKGGSAPKFREAEKRKVIELQDANHSATLRKIADEFKEASGQSISSSSVSRILADNDFTTKQLIHLPAERNSPANLRLRADFSLWVVEQDRSSLVFVDETGFNLHLRRKRGRSKKARRAYVQQPANKQVNISVLAALSPTRGLLKFEMKIGAYDADGKAFFSFFSFCLSFFFFTSFHLVFWHLVLLFSLHRLHL